MFLLAQKHTYFIILYFGNPVRRVLERIKNNVSYFGSLTVAGRDYIGELLAEVVDDFNASERRREGVRRAFQHTILPVRKVQIHIPD